MTDQNPPATTKQTMPFDSLLAQGRDLVCERLTEALDGMFDKMDDTVSALINETQDPDTRKLYLETKDKAFTQRESIEENFRSHYLREFQARSNRTRKTGQSFSEMDALSSELDLVGEDDLNETLKLNDMAAKLRQYCDEELVALDQRVGVLLGDANLEAEDNPFSPQVICDAFKHTCRKVDPNVKVRMVLLKLFDDHVLDDIRSVYKAVNALLVQNSILPRIRFRVSRAQESGKVPPSVAPADGKAGAVARVADKVPGGEPDFFSVLQDLLASNVKAMTPAGSSVGTGASVQGAAAMPGLPSMSGVPGSGGVTGAPLSGMPLAGMPLAGMPLTGAPVVVLQGAELMNLLTRVQHGDTNAVAEGGGLPLTVSAGEPGTTNVLRELKASSVGTGMNQLDSMTLDIVAMLFDQLFDDPKIPIEVKGLIGRMQIPMLKVAIADKEFFSKKSHPARQLLDTLGEISSRLPADFNSSDPLFGRLEGIIQELMNNFQDNLEIFGVVRQRLQTLVEEEDRRAEEETQLAAKRIEQDESLAASKTMAEFEVKTRVEAGNLPRAVKEFLMHQWVKPLLILHVRRGQHSDAWKNSLATMDLLIWSVEPKNTSEEREKLTAEVPDLLKRLSAGLKIADVEDAICERFFSDLKDLHAEAMSTSGEGEPVSAQGVGAENLLAKPDASLAIEFYAVPAAKTDAAPVAESDTALTMKFDAVPATTSDAPSVTESDTALTMKLDALPATTSDAASVTEPDTSLTIKFDALPATRPDAASGTTPNAEPATKQDAAPATKAALPAVKPAAAPAAKAAGLPATKSDTAPAIKPAPATAAADATPVTSRGAVPPARPVITPPAGPGVSPAARPAAAPFSKPGVVPPTRPGAVPPPRQGAVPPIGPGVVPPSRPGVTPAARPASVSATRPEFAPPGKPMPGPGKMVQPVAAKAGEAPAAVGAQVADLDSLDFTKTLTIKNPFGGGKVNVKELESAEIRTDAASDAKGVAYEVQFISNLKEGTWVEFRDQGAGDTPPPRPAKLSYISPLRSSFLFVDKLGKTVKECTRTDLGRLVRLRMVVIIDVVADEAPLFDRMMAGVIDKLR